MLWDLHNSYNRNGRYVEYGNSGWDELDVVDQVGYFGSFVVER